MFDARHRKDAFVAEDAVRSRQPRIAGPARRATPEITIKFFR